MADQLSVALHVLALSDRGVQCATQQAPDWAMWLPRRGSVTWVHEPKIGGLATCIIPFWLCAKHRQLDSVVAYEKRVRAEYAKPIEPTQKEAIKMATTKDNSGVLFRNTKKDESSPNAPDYTGDLLITGVRWRLAGWIKESARGKFLSLSVKPDEQKSEATKPATKKPAMADADSEIPF
jgi:hypothetical protein